MPRCRSDPYTWSIQGVGVALGCTKIRSQKQAWGVTESRRINKANQRLRVQDPKPLNPKHQTLNLFRGLGQLCEALVQAPVEGFGGV